MSHTGTVYSENVIVEYQKKVKLLEGENKKLKGEQLTEENAIRYVYENTSEYDDWVKGSEVYKELQEEVEELKEKDTTGSGALQVWQEEACRNLGENIKLKKENKKLTEYAEEQREIMSKVIDGMKQEILKLQEEIKKLKEENKKLKEGTLLKFQEVEIADLQEENEKLKEENKKLEWDYDIRGDIVKGLKETIFELEMKGNARKDIIKNMFECITADLEEVEDGFTIKRDWGHKCIDKWNEIVTQEYKDALKEINGQLEDIEWETDGYQFDLNIVDESESEEDSDDPDEE